MKTRFVMDGAFGTPFSDEARDRIKTTFEDRPDVLYASFIQYVDGQYRFLVTEIIEHD
jgi:hypothetical protein